MVGDPVCLVAVVDIKITDLKPHSNARQEAERKVISGMPTAAGPWSV